MDTNQGGADEAESSEDYPEFYPPKDFKLAGESGKATVTWTRKPGGAVCFTSLNGMSLDQSREEQQEDAPPPEPAMGDGMDAMAREHEG